MKPKKFMMIGAHPDDADLVFGGTALKLIKLGHKVKFVSSCNGDKGHYCVEPVALAARRKLEAQSSAKIAGLEEYEVLNFHDCELEATLEMRRVITGIIRDFAPDVVITHRTCDYHADHRATAQLVQDSAYLVTVPLFCPEHPVPPQNPVYMFSYDRFHNPRPFRPDIAVAIDDVLEDKLRMLNCHVSQFYEWLPYNQGRLDQVPTDWNGRRNFLIDGWLGRNRDQAEQFRGLLSQCGGNASAIYAETFELSEYGRQIEADELHALFPR